MRRGCHPPDFVRRPAGTGVHVADEDRVRQIGASLLEGVPGDPYTAHRWVMEKIAALDAVALQFDRAYYATEDARRREAIWANQFAVEWSRTSCSSTPAGSPRSSPSPSSTTRSPRCPSSPLGRSPGSAANGASGASAPHAISSASLAVVANPRVRARPFARSQLGARGRADGVSGTSPRRPRQPTAPTYLTNLR